MPKLIEADAFWEDLVAGMKSRDVATIMTTVKKALMRAPVIEAAPTIDAVPVVRCSECRNSSQIASDIADRMRHCWNGRGRSTGDGFSRVKQNGYCDEGEKMDTTRAEAEQEGTP